VRPFGAAASANARSSRVLDPCCRVRRLPERCETLLSVCTGSAGGVIHRARNIARGNTCGRRVALCSAASADRGGDGWLFTRSLAAIRPGRVSAADQARPRHLSAGNFTAHSYGGSACSPLRPRGQSESRVLLGRATFPNVTRAPGLIDTEAVTPSRGGDTTLQVSDTRQCAYVRCVCTSSGQ
jgi:hypothetical protein